MRNLSLDSNVRTPSQRGQRRNTRGVCWGTMRQVREVMARAQQDASLFGRRASTRALAPGRSRWQPCRAVAGEVVLVVPCFNEEQRFQPAAFLALAREPNLHLVLVDDGS